jgi:hypothetical protein
MLSKWIGVDREWFERVAMILDRQLPSGKLGDALFLLREQAWDLLDPEREDPMSVLSDQFKRARKVKPANSPGVHFSVWEEGAEYKASVSVFGGSIGGSGKTPEEAIDAATRALVASRKG